MSENEFEHYFAMGLGIALGAGLTFLTQGLWTITAGPATEWLLERGKSPKDAELPPEAREDKLESNTDENRVPRARVDRWDEIVRNGKCEVAQGQILRVLISDPHIDTWEADKRISNGRLLPRRALDFIDLLETLKALAQKTQPNGKPFYKGVELYINGDLTDVPLHPAHIGRFEPDEMVFEDELKGVLVKGKTWQGVLPKTLDAVLAALRDVVHDDEAPLRIFYFTGNHDIGIGGLRYFRPGVRRTARSQPLPTDEVLDLPAHVMWNPGGVIRTGAGKDDPWVYVEHGHMHDPVLWLYMRYAIFDLLRGGFRHQGRRLLGRMQRKGKVGQNAQHGPSLNEKPEFAPTEKLAASEAPRPTSVGNSLRDFAFNIVKLRYRYAARRTARWLNKYYNYGKRPFTIIFGHTHIEDKMTFSVNGTPYTYINAGSWAGTQDRQTFWVIEPTSNVAGPFQWPG